MTESSFPKTMPHGSVQTAFEHVHFVAGTVQFKPMLSFGRLMTLLEHDGEITVINAVRVSEAVEKEIEALGRVAHVMKIGSHGMDDPYYLDRFGADYWALPNAVPAEGSKAKPITADGALPIPQMKAFVFELTKNPEAALLLPWNGGLLVTCDSVQNWEDTKGCSVMAKVAMRAMGFIKPAQIGPPWRKANTPEGGSLKPDFDRLVELPFKHLIAGHGVPLLDSAHEQLSTTIARVYS